MIDWTKTKQLCGHNSIDGHRPQVIVACDKCGKERPIKIRNKSKIVEWQMPWECPACVCIREDVSSNLSKSTKASWNDPEYRRHISKCSRSNKNNKKLSKSSSLLWKDESYRQKAISAIRSRWANESYRNKLCDHLEKARNSIEHKKAVRAACATPEFREKMRSIWTDPEYRQAMAKINANRPKVSNIQELLYSMLDDMGIKYYREYNDRIDDSETTIGPYHFDCVIPRPGKPTLLIECQGDYWHSRKETITKDSQKAAYIENNFSGEYEIKYIWEHEFYELDRLRSLLNYWVEKDLEVIDFDLNSVEIRKCNASEYRPLLMKFHYLANAGRGGLAYGAYLHDTLIAVCVFSPMVRQNIKENNKDTRELSRLCIHPKYQKRNLASWFISRSIKMLPCRYKRIIAFSDTTYNHTGTIYKACGFKLVDTLKPDYWYRKNNGWVMHKKTLYNRARVMGMTENQFAEQYGYVKIWGKEKLKFELIRFYGSSSS